VLEWYRILATVADDANDTPGSRAAALGHNDTHERDRLEAVLGSQLDSRKSLLLVRRCGRVIESAVSRGSASSGRSSDEEVVLPILFGGECRCRTVRGKQSRGHLFVLEWYRILATVADDANDTPGSRAAALGHNDTHERDRLEAVLGTQVDFIVVLRSRIGRHYFQWYQECLWRAKQAVNVGRNLLSESGSDPSTILPSLSLNRRPTMLLTDFQFHAMEYERGRAGKPPH
jgi:hypothetical protein